MIAMLSLIPAGLIAAWLISEFRGRTSARVALGLAAILSVAVMAFFWGRFIEAFIHMEFLVPHDRPPDPVGMEAAGKAADNITPDGPSGGKDGVDSDGHSR
jgi:hypothetical protein